MIERSSIGSRRSILQVRNSPNKNYEMLSIQGHGSRMQSGTLARHHAQHIASGVIIWMDLPYAKNILRQLSHGSVRTLSRNIWRLISINRMQMSSGSTFRAWSIGYEPCSQTIEEKWKVVDGEYSIISSKIRNTMQQNSREKSQNLCKMKMSRKSPVSMNISWLGMRNIWVSAHSLRSKRENPMSGSKVSVRSVASSLQSRKWKQIISLRGTREGKQRLKTVRCSVRIAIGRNRGNK